MFEIDVSKLVMIFQKICACWYLLCLQQSSYLLILKYGKYFNGAGLF